MIGRLRLNKNMPRLTIDNREVEVPPGATILAAAQTLGINIPTLCYLEGCPPSTSCLVCTVKVLGNGRLVPSCATLAADGMQVESETAEIHQVRRSALELLLSDHLGDCLAPCQLACPAGMNIPQMLRQIAAEDSRGAIVTVKRDIALPAVLGRICPAPCEKACRRRPADGAVSICLLKRFVADADLASSARYLPECRPSSVRRVAIVGAGPAGWSAAYYLLQQGHACTIFDENEKPGGRLRHETSADELPHEILNADLEPVLRLGAELRMNTRIGGREAFEGLRHEFDAVLVACGATAKQQAETWGLETAQRGVQVAQDTYETSLAGVFAAGNAIRGKGLVVRSAADGKEAAISIDQYLSGCKVSGPQKPFSTRIGRLEEDELALYLAGASQSPRRDPSSASKGYPAAGFTPQEAVEQSARCMHCDCRGVETCKLRRYSDLYGADPRRYKDARKPFRQDRQHAAVIYEPGKCIQCGLCIEIAAQAGEPLGLTFIGRGFDVRVGAPLDASLREALQTAAAQCVAACPTAALSWAEGKSAG
jgi:NADPH-dependent glutamate synthase beta subunit-like oxidoreductase/ferredoxin